MGAWAPASGRQRVIASRCLRLGRGEVAPRSGPSLGPLGRGQPGWGQPGRQGGPNEGSGEEGDSGILTLK